MNKAIGGYFELELPSEKGEYYPEAYSFQSARAAFLALLQVGKPTRVWMPRYLCDSLFEPLRQINIPFELYSINENLEVADPIKLDEDEWLLYVNYFGVCDHQVTQILEHFPSGQVVIDHSQAFFSPPPDCLATIYSPRKFFGVPDGGYLITRMLVPEPVQEDTDSLSRCTHLLKRLAVGPEHGYADYRAAEASFSGLPPLRMSKLTHRLLSSIDYESVKVCRNHNFERLHVDLGKKNQLPLFLSLDKKITPLCYPFLSSIEGIRDIMIANKIFVPTYWPDVLKKASIKSIEAELLKNLIPIPIDQRYAPDTLINSLNRVF